jgi:predicted RNA-binding Zn ribbon-like protein
MLPAAITLREAIYRLFAAEAAGQKWDSEDLSALNAALAEAPPRESLALGAVKGWDVPWAGVSVTALLAPVLWSAGDLLLGPRAGRVRQCANPACGWLFLDDSKSGNRRWCSMSACGNRAKAHRHYLRRKGSGA